MTLRVVSHGSPEYHATLALRDAILRAPLGLAFSDEEVAAESSQVHIAAVDDSGAVRGCLVLRPAGDGSCHMRQVAVAEPHRGTGLGRALVRFAEEHARDTLGARRIFCHAREPVVPFYEKLGYVKTGEPFEEVTIPHQAMEKPL